MVWWVRTAAVPAAFLVALASPAAVFAATSAVAQESLSVASARWGVVAVPAGTEPIAGPLRIDWVNVKGQRIAFIDLVNVSTLTTTGQTFTITSVATSSGNNKTPVLALDACVGGTWSGDSCDGSVVRLGTTEGGSFSSLTAIESGGRLSVRVTKQGSSSADFRTTIDTSIDRSQVRPAVTRNG